MGKEKGRQKDYLHLFQVIVLGSNIAAVTQECILLWQYLFDQINSNLVVMQNVSHWIYLILSAAASPVFSLSHPQKPVKNPIEGARVWKMHLRTLRTSWRIGSFSLFLLSLHAQLSVLHLHYNPKLFDSVMYHSMPEEGCSAAPLKLHFYEQYWILEARKHKAMGIV